MIEIVSPTVDVYDINELFNSLPVPSNINIPNRCCERLSEYIGRVCYNSYDKLTGDSFINFNRKAASDAHRSIFEFNNLKLCISVTEAQLYLITPFLASCPYIKYDFVYNETLKDEVHYLLNIVGSIRAFIEILEKFVMNEVPSDTPAWLFRCIYSMASALTPTVLGRWATIDEITNYNAMTTDMVYACPSHRYADITQYTALKNDKYKKFLIRIVSDKGLHNELVRHRPMSVMAESQRYVRYGIGDNVKNPFTVCIAAQHLTDARYTNAVLAASETAFNHYKELLALNYPAQQARAVLPVATAMTYFIYLDRDELNHLLSLRAAKSALPMSQEVTQEIFLQLINKHLI